MECCTKALHCHRHYCLPDYQTLISPIFLKKISKLCKSCLQFCVCNVPLSQWCKRFTPFSLKMSVFELVNLSLMTFFILHALSVFLIISELCKSFCNCVYAEPDPHPLSHWMKMTPHFPFLSVNQFVQWVTFRFIQSDLEISTLIAYNSSLCRTGCDTDIHAYYKITQNSTK